jgi:hypothetical protein
MDKIATVGSLVVGVTPFWEVGFPIAYQIRGFYK